MKAENSATSTTLTKESKKSKQTEKKAISKTPAKSTKTSNTANVTKKFPEKQEQTAAATAATTEQGETHNFWVLFFSYLLLFFVLGVGFIYVCIPKINFAELFLDIMIIFASFLKSKGKLGYQPSE